MDSLVWSPGQIRELLRDTQELKLLIPPRMDVTEVGVFWLKLERAEPLGRQVEAGLAPSQGPNGEYLHRAPCGVQLQHLLLVHAGNKLKFLRHTEVTSSQLRI